MGNSIFWGLSNVTIKYQGTKAQWEAIDRSVEWEEDESFSEKHTLQCSDGIYEAEDGSGGK